MGSQVGYSPQSQTQVAKLCLTLCDPRDCNSLGSSVHRILQAGILEWVSMPSSRVSSQPRDQTHVFCISFFSRQFLYRQCHLGRSQRLDMTEKLTFTTVDLGNCGSQCSTHKFLTERKRRASYVVLPWVPTVSFVKVCRCLSGTQYIHPWVNH